jgi:hypothetical protein
VGGVALLSRWGVTGAALAVLVATAVMTLLMMQLLSTITPLRWRDLVAPLVPGLVCATGLGAVVGGVRAFLYANWPATPDAVSLLVLAVVAVCYMVVFLFLQPFESVREVVGETIEDFAPKLAGPLKGFSH